MKILNNKSKVIFVASVTGGGGSDQCPRVIVVNHKAIIKDDYAGKINTKGRLLNSLFAI